MHNLLTSTIWQIWKQYPLGNLANDGNRQGIAKLLEVIKSFELVNNLRLNYEITSRREGDVAVMYASTELAKQILGWSAKRDLKKMVASAWKWEQNLRK